MTEADRPIACAVLGLGRMGYRSHYTRLAGDPRFRVVAVADAFTANRERAASDGAGRCYADARELLAGNAATTGRPCARVAAASCATTAPTGWTWPCGGSTSRSRR